MTNARITKSTNAPSSVTTSSEGTTAPVATATTWMWTTTLALVQIIKFASKHSTESGFNTSEGDKNTQREVKMGK